MFDFVHTFPIMLIDWLIKFKTKRSVSPSHPWTSTTTLSSPDPINSTPYDAVDEKKSAQINYTCKKCNLIFQRYYELIRHQKNHCFKEENNKKSAKAQIAAAQIAQSLSSEDSNSSLEINHANNLLGNNLLHPVTSTTKSQQTLSQSLDTAATSKTPPIAATKMNLNHPVNLITTSSGTHPNIMVNEHCHNLQNKKITNFQKSRPRIFFKDTFKSFSKT